MKNRTVSNPLYTQKFFDERFTKTQASYKVIVPYLMKLVNPKSVVDIGCSTGIALSIFKENGVERIVGVDGPWVPPRELKIPRENFLKKDLTKPMGFRESFDLALSFEVAEHLPKESAEVFVESLTQTAPVIAFSAAIPNQGGLGHVNEQWPDYWADLFGAKGFRAIDCLRPKLYNDPRTHWSHAQNMLLFVEEGHTINEKEMVLNSKRPMPFVHPWIWLNMAERASYDARKLPMKDLLPIISRRIRKKIKRLLRFSSQHSRS